MRALAASLETLVLAGNSLSSVPEAVLWNLGRLVRLDLSRNNIINIHSMAFQTGLPALAYLHLADNLLGRTHMLGIVERLLLYEANPMSFVFQNIDPPTHFSAR
jgi:Leucine-rich repeat (LRR) protein